MTNVDDQNLDDPTQFKPRQVPPALRRDSPSHPPILWSDHEASFSSRSDLHVSGSHRHDSYIGWCHRRFLLCGKSLGREFISDL